MDLLDILEIILHNKILMIDASVLDLSESQFFNIVNFLPKKDRESLSKVCKIFYERINNQLNLLPKEMITCITEWLLLKDVYALSIVNQYFYASLLKVNSYFWQSLMKNLDPTVRFYKKYSCCEKVDFVSLNPIKARYYVRNFLKKKKEIEKQLDENYNKLNLIDWFYYSVKFLKFNFAKVIFLKDAYEGYKLNFSNHTNMKLLLDLLDNFVELYPHLKELVRLKREVNELRRHCDEKAEEYQNKLLAITENDQINKLKNILGLIYIKMNRSEYFFRSMIDYEDSAKELLQHISIFLKPLRKFNNSKNNQKIKEIYKLAERIKKKLEEQQTERKRFYMPCIISVLCIYAVLFVSFIIAFTFLIILLKKLKVYKLTIRDFIRSVPLKKKLLVLGITGIFCLVLWIIEFFAAVIFAVSKEHTDSKYSDKYGLNKP
ncbi:MAG: hypothetical protein AMS24_01005 [Chlamydiae bacterium SM23_39]|nr:MAG: hypothetical protein AMS24_01005 [Chlamydiae bacterium SM23_39]